MPVEGVGAAAAPCKCHVLIDEQALFVFARTQKHERTLGSSNWSQFYHQALSAGPPVTCESSCTGSVGSCAVTAGYISGEFRKLLRLHPLELCCHGAAQESHSGGQNLQLEFFQCPPCRSALDHNLRMKCVDCGPKQSSHGEHCFSELCPKLTPGYCDAWFSAPC
jgi:hypothetical protein